MVSPLRPSAALALLLLGLGVARAQPAPPKPTPPAPEEAALSLREKFEVRKAIWRERKNIARMKKLKKDKVKEAKKLKKDYDKKQKEHDSIDHQIHDLEHGRATSGGLTLANERDILKKIEKLKLRKKELAE